MKKNNKKKKGGEESNKEVHGESSQVVDLERLSQESPPETLPERPAMTREAQMQKKGTDTRKENKEYQQPQSAIKVVGNKMVTYSS